MKGTRSKQIQAHKNVKENVPPVCAKRPEHQDSNIKSKIFYV
jgi:hypothetical protein